MTGFNLSEPGPVFHIHSSTAYCCISTRIPAWASLEIRALVIKKLSNKLNGTKLFQRGCLILSDANVMVNNAYKIFLLGAANKSN